MCKDCGCNVPGPDPVKVSGEPVSQNPAQGHGHEHEHGHGHGHSHHHDHDHDHGHGHTHEAPADAGSEPVGPALPEAGRRTVEVQKSLLEDNDRLAERLRGFFRARGIVALNVFSSPGSGKTTFLRETVRQLGSGVPTGLIVGDLATDNDARRLREAGAPVVQVTTGTMCHLEADMITRALRQFDTGKLRLMIIENVGNLVCPAAYDLGEDLRVVLLSVTEGEDKPLKYPPMFQAAHVVVLSKIDLAGPCEFDREAALANLRQVAPQARVFELSAKTGQGMAGWLAFVQTEIQNAPGKGL